MAIIACVAAAEVRLPQSASRGRSLFAALGSEAVQRLVQTITIFDDFCTANDPHGEHDFGAFEFEGAPIMFKIDYYDKDLNFYSPNPADPAVTERVLTIMLAEEY